MPSIFISYRRDDTEVYADRLADDLRRQFGDDEVFIDREALEPGADFVEGIERAVESADVALVLIGPTWLSATDASGRPRLIDLHDFVHIEVAAVLERQIRVVPVLLHGASMPTAEQLPEPLAALSRRQAFEIHNRSWRQDVQRLVTVLEAQIRRRRQERLVDATGADQRTSSSTSGETPINARAVGYLIAAGWLIGVTIGESGGYINRPTIWPLRVGASWWLGGAVAALVIVLALSGQKRAWTRMLWIALAAGLGAELIDGVIWTFVREGVEEVVAGQTLKLVNAILCALIVGLGAVYAAGGPRPDGRIVLCLVVGAALGIIGEGILKLTVSPLASRVDPLWIDRIRLGVWIVAGLLLVCWQLARPTGAGLAGRSGQSKRPS